MKDEQLEFLLSMLGHMAESLEEISQTLKEMQDDKSKRETPRVH